MDSQIRRRRTFDALKRLFLRESLNRPLILMFEDLHWIDSETQGWLDTLSESVAGARILLLVNYRPEYRHEWGTKTYYTQLRLAPLGKDEAEELLTFLLGSDPSLTTLKHLILEKTEGTPFFMEEVVQELFEQGVLLRDGVETRRSASLPTNLHLPTTVQGVLAARIDRLVPDEKALLQQLAVIGRELPLSLLKSVVAQPEDALYRLLASLQHKEFLYEQPAFPEGEYIFKHALTQEVAYQSVLHERRKAIHERTAQAMEALYHATLDEHYSEFAYHYSRSGNTQKAVEYLRLAGQQAVQRSANAEAISHLTSALELLRTLPDTPERTQRELMLQIALGMPLMALKGSVAPEVESTYTRARELCRQLGETPQLFPVLAGLFPVYFTQGRLQKAHELAEQLLSLAHRQQDPALLLEAHHAYWTTARSRGELAVARVHAEHGLALYDAQHHRAHAFLYSGHDPGVCGWSELALTLWLQGYPAQALQSSQKALALAQQLTHPLSLAFALYLAAMLHQLRQERQAVQERAEAAITLSTEQGFPLWLALGTILRGWALAEQGQREKGVTQMRQGLAAYRATGGETLRPYHLALLAEAYGKVGQREEGLSVLVEALAWVEKTERMYEAELYRLKGELRLQQSSIGSPALGVPTPQHVPSTSRAEAEAEACFRKAIEITRKQQTKSLELRAAMSLSRLWHQQGKRADAHKLLSDIYSWFTEGFNTKDLQAAKALLDALAEGR